MNLPIPEIWEIHPTLVHFPIALLLAGVVTDFLARSRPTLTRPAARLMLASVVLGWLTAAAGLLSFYTAPAQTEQAHTLMWWHLGFGETTLLLFTWIGSNAWRARQFAARNSHPLAELTDEPETPVPLSGCGSACGNDIETGGNSI